MIGEVASALLEARISLEVPKLIETAAQITEDHPKPFNIILYE